MVDQAKPETETRLFHRVRFMDSYGQNQIGYLANSNRAALSLALEVDRSPFDKLGGLTAIVDKVGYPVPKDKTIRPESNARIDILAETISRRIRAKARSYLAYTIG